MEIIAENIFACEDYSFENGIIGFGWLIAFLYQKKYININSDETLEDFDDQIYKITLLYLSEDQVKIDDLLGLVNYFLLRHRNMNFGENYFRKFVHSECLNLIFNYFIDYIETCIYKSTITNSEFDYCCKILLKCGYCIEYIFHKNLFDKLIEFHIYYIQYLEKKIREEDQPSLYIEGFLYLLLSVKQRKYKILEKKLSYMSRSLKVSFLNHFVYKIYSDNDLKYSSLQNDELIFLLTNCIKS